MEAVPVPETFNVSQHISYIEVKDVYSVNYFSYFKHMLSCDLIT